MDGEGCMDKFESNHMEEGELEDGELVDNVDDEPPTKSPRHSICHEESAPSNYGDRKKKSKKRKREEPDKVHCAFNDQRRSPNHCDTFINHGSVTANNKSFVRNDQTRAVKGSHDFSGEEVEDYDDTPVGVSDKQWANQNEPERYESPRLKRHQEKKRGRHKGKKTKRSAGNDSNYFDERGCDETYIKRDSELQKTFKHGSNKRMKFNTHASNNKGPVCKYFLEGKCFKGDECSFRHCYKTQKKEDLCKHYMTGGCKKSSCLFYHGDWPCREFHLRGDCESGEYCKFSHEELTEETEKLLYVPMTEVSSNNNRKQSPGSSFAEDLLCHGLEDKKKIPSLLDIEIFPPGYIPKRPSPIPRSHKGGNARIAGAHKFAKGTKRGGLTNAPFGGSNFDGMKTHSNDFMRQDGNNSNRRQGWGRKPYGIDWCKKDRQQIELNENEFFCQEDYSTQNFCNGRNFDKNVEDINEAFSPEKSRSGGQEGETRESYNSDCAETPGANQIKDNKDDFAIEDNYFGGNDCNREDRADVHKSKEDTEVANASSSDPKLQHGSQQNIFQGNVQIPNAMRMARPILRIPPPNIMPMPGNGPRGLRLNPGSCPQPGILGAPPMGGQMAPNSVPHGMAPLNVPHHISLPQPQGIQSPQLIGQFVPPQQSLAGMLGRGPRPMFPASMPPVNNQPFLQLPPFPPPRFDLNQIIRNIVRNTLNSQSPMFMVNQPPPMPCPPINGSCNPVPESAHPTLGEEINHGPSDSANANLPNVKLGSDPRLKSKDDKTEVTTEDNDSGHVLKEEKGEALCDAAPEVDGTAKQVEYCLKPLTLCNNKPSIPVEILMKFKEDLSSCEDPRMRSYSRSLSDLKFDTVNKSLDPRSFMKIENKKPDSKIPGLSSASLQSAETEITSNGKPYSLPSIFIPPTSAPNIELEEKAFSKMRHRKNSGPSPLFSPTRDLTSLFSEFPNQRDLQLPEITIKQNQPPKFGSPECSTRSIEKGQKKVIDYRNDPRFKKKKLLAKSEDESKEAEKHGDVRMISPTASIMSSTSHEEILFDKQIIGESPVARIPSPNPTFPLYCTNFQMAGLYMSNSTEELEDGESESNDENVLHKGAMHLECEMRNDPQSLSGPSPFLPEQEEESETMEEINLKDMFKTIDPTTSPFC